MRLILTCALAWGLAAVAAPAAEPAKPPAETVVLDLNRGSFRAFEGWRTPTLISADGKLKPLLEPRRKDLKEEDRKPVPVRGSAPPPANWAAVDFDDSFWPRVYEAAALNKWPASPLVYDGRYAPRNPVESSLVCLRGAFRVSDPGQVADLKLTLRYYGGAVVYVNGVELGRGHLPAGKLEPGALAERYPDEAYVKADGKVHPGDEKTAAELLTVRGRSLPAKDAAGAVAIPGSMLRKGVNVIAVEVRAAPVNELLFEGTAGAAAWKGERNGWPHAMLAEARVTSASGSGLAGGAGPSQGIEIGNCSPIEQVYAYDPAQPAEAVRPIRMIGARNGVFSGRVALSSANAIRNLRAQASELLQPGGQGKIPASAVQVRWAERAMPPVSWSVHWDPLGCVWFDRLIAAFPAEIPQATLTGARLKIAVAPVWVTVRVPADAPAGEYRGTLTVEADGAAPFKALVPVELKIHDWRVPDPKDFTVLHNIYQSPDSVAQYYKVPLWSERHWELVGRSLKAFGEVGSKVCAIHLVAKSPSFNNSEGMVRWVKRADGGYDHDFSIAEKYMDAYEKNCGKPALVHLDAWHCPENMKDFKATLPVSVLDPATGKVEPMPQPTYGTPENEAFWKPVLTELRKRLEKRGWWDVTAVCHINYAAGPHKTVVDTYKAIWPDGRWMNCSHTNPKSYAASQGSMPVPYSEFVWGAGAPYDPDGGGRPWPAYPRAWTSGSQRIEWGNPRQGLMTLVVELRAQTHPLAAYRFISEATLQGNLRGLGRVGGDSWPLPIGKGGKLEPLFDSFKAVGPGEHTVALFSPGPDGAIHNERTEVFREGVQVAEAIICLQRAQQEKRASAEQSRRIDELLDERARCILRSQEWSRVRQTMWTAMECSGWQDRDDRLFALCAEVAARK